MFALSVLTGLTIYARYQSCDLITSQKNLKPDQLVPYFILDVGNNFPGIAGLFVAGILSAALSSISSYLNAIGGVIYKDLLCKFFKKKFSDTTAKNILKILIILEGILSIGISFWFKNSKNLYEVAVRSLAVLSGPLLGTFLLGILFPRANSKVIIYC